MDKSDSKFNYYK